MVCPVKSSRIEELLIFRWLGRDIGDSGLGTRPMAINSRSAVTYQSALESHPVSVLRSTAVGYTVIVHCDCRCCSKNLTPSRQGLVDNGAHCRGARDIAVGVG